ncbi:hypothetical protein [Phenylobacterium sp.]|uniref:hypothetical protein n=1 Tax=Phenylobacterium sp. TaxID=1871053 RepID=UPI003D2814B4
MSETRTAGDATPRTWFRTRLEAQLRLALLGDTAGPATLAQLMNQAQRAGLSGAEIDAALAGRSFEVRTSSLLAYALKQGDPVETDLKRQRGARLGVTASAFDRIAQATDRILRDAR